MVVNMSMTFKLNQRLIYHLKDIKEITIYSPKSFNYSKGDKNFIDSLASCIN